MVRVLVIGLDGATWDLIKPWADKGHLPTFKKLIDNGVWSELESTIPPWTFPAWSSMTTGKNPGNLPLFTFVIKKGYDFKPYIAVTNERERNIWDLLSRKGKKVCVVNLPNVYSAYTVNGYMVSGWFCLSDELITFPPRLIDEIEQELSSSYEIDVVSRWGTQRIKAKNDKEYLKSVISIGEKHFKTFKYLLENKKWDFAFICFVEPDRIQHRFWEDKNLLLELYKRMDRYINDLLGRVGKNSIVFLVSDHGFGSAEESFNVNEWLKKEGYLKLRSDNFDFFDKISLISAVKVLLRLFPVKVKKILVNIVNIVNNININKYININKIRTRSESFNIQEYVDWTKTKAFAYGVFGDIYINVKGREPEGIVDWKDYETLRDEIIRKFSDVTRNSKFGQKYSPVIFKREEIYKGKFLKMKPDLIILVNDCIQAINPKLGSNKVFVKGKGGNHRINGIFLAFGPEIKRGEQIKNAKIYDIAPTILHIFGLPIPDDMDGRVLLEIFEPDSEIAARKPVYYHVSSDKSEKEKLKAKIKKFKSENKL